MGDWSDYFEDFPEENPANWVNGRFDPAAAALLRDIEEGKRYVAIESELLRQKMEQMAAEAKLNAAKRDANAPPGSTGNKKTAP